MFTRIGPVFLGHFLMTISFGMINPVLGLYAQGFGVSVGQTGFLFAIGAGVSIVGAPLVGRAAERIRAEYICIVVFALSSVSICGTYFSDSFGELLFWRFLGGVHAAGIPTLLAALSASVPQETRGVVASWIQGLIPVGFVIGPALSGLFLNSISGQGIETAVAVAGALSCLASLVFAVAIRNALASEALPAERKAHAGSQQPRSGTATMLSIVAVPVIVSVTALFIYSGVFSVLYRWVSVSEGSDTAVIGFAYSFFSLCNASAQLFVFPLIHKRVESKRLALYSIGLLALGALLQVVGSGAVNLMLSIAFLTTGAGLCASACTDWILLSIGDGPKTSLFGTLGLINGVAKLLSPIALSYGIAYLSLETLFGVATLLAITALAVAMIHSALRPVRVV